VSTVTAPAARDYRVTQARVILSEWTKLRTLRSSVWSLLGAVVFMAGLGIVVAALQVTHWSQLDPHDRATYDPVGTALIGALVAQLAIGVLGVLVVTGEYATGTIRATFAAVPRRLPVLWAKALVFLVVTAVLMTFCALVAFFGTQPIVSTKHVETSFGTAGVARAVIGAGLYLTVVGLLGVSLGALVRNTAGGIGSLAGIMFVLPGVAAILPHSWGDAINPYLPSSAGAQIMAWHPDPSGLAPWTGFGLFLAYTLATLAVAAVLLVRRDT
jgi:ABC-type transport system involved in multi-copper enzyme maturation permease subunit